MLILEDELYPQQDWTEQTIYKWYFRELLANLPN